MHGNTNVKLMSDIQKILSDYLLLLSPHNRTGLQYSYIMYSHYLLSQLHNVISSLFYTVTEVSYFKKNNDNFINKYLLLL